MRHFIPRLLLILAAALLCSCFDKSHLPQKIGIDDPELTPLWEALARVDRASMGFSPIAKTSDIRIERASPGGAYDIMLHIADATTSRTIAFRKTSTTCKWINEQEKHTGPRTSKDADGFPQHEILFIICQNEPLTGVAVNQTVIQYFGDDPRLSGRTLTLAEIRPILKEWDAK